MLSGQELAQYWEDGFVISRGLLLTEELDPVIQRIDAQVAELAAQLYSEGLISSTFDDLGFEKRLAALERAYSGASVIIHSNGILPLEFAKLWSNPKLLEVIEQLLGPEIAGHPVWNLRAKTPMTALATVPWHQDTAYLEAGAEDTFQPTAWIPLVDTNEVNGTLQVIRGGHKNQTLPHHLEKKLGKSDSWYLYIREEDLPPGEVVTCSLRKGDVLFLNQLIPHRSTENYSQEVRWSLDFRWQRPNEPSGFSDKSCIVMRSLANPMHEIDWESWAKESRQTKITETGKSVKVDYDLNTNITGPWLDRWSKLDTAKNEG
jgi:hypothetical protein